MAKPPNFSLAFVITAALIAFLYLGMVVMSMFTEMSGKMEMMNVQAMSIPSAALTIIVGALVFLPKIVAGPDRLKRAGLWLGHLVLCTTLSIVLLVLGTFLVIGLG